MGLLLSVSIFALALLAVVRGADYVITSAERLGSALRLSPFVIGVVIIGFGTSLPELATSLGAIFNNLNDVPAALVIGSNISNILLIVGIIAVVGRRIVTVKNLLDVDLPLLLTSTLFFGFIIYDRIITFGESILLLCVFSTFLLYSLLEGDGELPYSKEHAPNKRRFTGFARNTVIFLFGITVISIAAHLVGTSTASIAAYFGIPAAFIALTATAIGTSLPELMVALRAALKQKTEIVIGNIIGSNVFNLTFVIGVVGLFGTLGVDEQTFMLAFPIMLVCSLLLVISGMSQSIHRWEGLMFLIFYITFIGKLFGLL